MAETTEDGEDPQDPNRPPDPWSQPRGPAQPGPSGGQPGYQPGYQQGYPAPPGFAGDHPRATMSLVLGILAVVLCQFIGPFAWVIGKRTVDEIDASGGQLGGRTIAQAGYVMGIVGTALLAVGALFLVLLLGLGVFMASP